MKSQKVRQFFASCPNSYCVIPFKTKNKGNKEGKQIFLSEVTTDLVQLAKGDSVEIKIHIHQQSRKGAAERRVQI